MSGISAIHKDDVIERLCSIAKRGELPHAVVLEADDVNKEGIKLALKVTKSLMCRSDKKVFCNKCSVCHKIDSNSHPDVQIVSVKPQYKSIRVDDIREIINDAYLSPNESAYKVYIIKDGGLMNQSAQNALLKIVEEPPKNVIFIIVCTSEFELISTIRSRSQAFSISASTVKSASTKVKDLCEGFINAFLCSQEFEVIKEISKLPKDRNSVKQILEFTRENAMERVKNSDMDLCLRLVKLAQELGEIEKLVDKNLNQSLLLSLLSVRLSEI